MKSLVAVLALAAAPAFADVVIDFENLAVGTAPGTAYQAQYGVTFNGGTIEEVNGSKVLAGHFSMTFNPPKDLQRVVLQGAQWQDGGTNWIHYASGYKEQFWSDGTVDPNCYGTNCTHDGYQFIYIPTTQLFTHTYASSPLDPVSGLDLILDYADNIRFVSSSWNDPAPSQVPIPAPWLLLGAGWLAYRLRR